MQICYKLTAIAIAGAILLDAGGARAQQATCSALDLGQNPWSVEDPCSALLKSRGLTTEQRAAALYVRGRGRHRTQRMLQAADDYVAAIKLSPRHSDIYVDLANVKLRSGREDESVRDLMTALTIDERNARALTALAGSFKRRNDHHKALPLLDAALSINPKLPFGLLWRSTSRSAVGRSEEALKDASDLVAIDPVELNRHGFINDRGSLIDFHILALHNRSALLRQSKRFSEAENDLNAAVAYSSSALTLTERGVYLTGQPGRSEDALRDFDEAVSLVPEYDHIQYKRGLVLLKLKRWNEALSAFDVELERFGPHAMTYLLRSQVLQKLGEFERMYEDQLRAATLNPKLIATVAQDASIAGYLPRVQTEQTMNPRIADALKACSLDPGCR